MRTPDAHDPRETGTRRLAVDRVACTGHGVCAQLLAEQLTLDEWGYPVVHDERAPTPAAHAAVTLCPARAIYLRQQ